MGVSPCLAFSDVACRRGGQPGLRGVSLAVHAGEGVALLGPNGAGKSTLTRLAVALAAPDQGVVTTLGESTRGRRPEEFAGRVGYLFQRPEEQLFATSVRDEVAFTPRRLGWDEPRVLAAAAAALAALQLEGEAGEHPLDLPRPARRLVALASAVVCRPRLLILDEPTSGLDRRSRRLVEGVVRLALEGGAAVLAATHDAGFAVEVLGRGVVLRAGRVEAEGPLDMLFGEGGVVGLPLPEPADLVRRLGHPGPPAGLAAAVRFVAARCRGAEPGPTLGQLSS